MRRLLLPMTIALATAQVATAAATAPTPKTSAEDLVGRAISAFQAGQDTDAERHALQAVAARDSRLAQAWLVIGMARKRSGHADTAAEAFRTALSSAPDERTARLVKQELAVDAPALPGPAALSEADRLAMSRVEPSRATFEGPRVRVEAPNLALTERIALLAGTELSRLWKQFLPDRPDLPTRVEILVWPDEKTYHKRAPHAPHRSAGCMIEGVDATGLRIARIDLRQNGADGQLTEGLLDHVLPHELCHAVLRDHLTGEANGCPLAIHEGLAMLAEHGPDDCRVRLAGAVLSGAAPGRIELEDLLSTALPDDVNMEIFYAESYSFVEFLHGRLTSRQFADFLACLSRGQDVPTALQQALLIAPDEQFLARLADAWERYGILQGQLAETLATTPVATPTAP